MKKQFVSYPIALAVYELGFDEKCFGYFKFPDILEYEICSSNEPNMKRRGIIAVPTWQQVIDYFRTKHNIVIELTRFEHRDDIIEWVYIIEKWDGNVIVEYNDCEHFNSYEEAREAAILQAIEIIKNK